ncbi:MAG TPA: hypothetical protein VNO33_12425 [Kofleriaceae bacterium]|nr:hypothetical protein [Kofleriaceae bacterium]
MNRLAILLTLAMFGAVSVPVGLTACGSGPYVGKPERLKKPRAKKRPDDKAAATEVAEGGDKDKPAKGAALSDEQCRTNFFAEPKRAPRRAKEARSMALQADAGLLAAERQFGAARQQLVIEAMGTLSNALDKDPYGPEPTYKLAVAYALVGQKSCSLALLERLKGLSGMPDVEKEASRTIQRASRDPAFEPFSKEARTALGQ